jgi:hypothetical protein
MSRAKSKAIIAVADGAGGLVQLQDRRFEQGDWPIQFQVSAEQADDWLQYLSVGCQKRGWSSGSIAQMEAKENSGTITVSSGVEGQQLAVVWERKRSGPIKVRARSSSASQFPLDQANDFFAHVNECSEKGATEEFYRAWQLNYEGLPWCGELWLDSSLRLGPPSQQDKTALTGPRIVLVNARVKGIDWQHANSSFELLLRELAGFLTVVLGKNIRVSPNGGRGWTWITDSSGKGVECDIRNLGYWESQMPAEMPTAGQVNPIPLAAVSRPDYSLKGIDGTKSELHLPQDILDLWRSFAGLSPEKRRQFLQVGSMWQLALSMGHEYQTARFAYMVAACEVLKPQDPIYRDHNIYQVIEALLGKSKVDLLQESWFRPQDVRNAHFHRGELRGSEFVQRAVMSSFEDPTFGQASRVLCDIAHAAIIEWLQRNGEFTMPPLERRRTWRRWVKDHTFQILPATVGVGIIVGLSLAWLFRVLGW